MAPAWCSWPDDEERANQEGEAAAGDVELQARGVREKAGGEGGCVQLLAPPEEREGIRRDGEAEQQQEEPSCDPDRNSLRAEHGTARPAPGGRKAGGGAGGRRGGG